jgi:hypothetical protein
MQKFAYSAQYKYIYVDNFCHGFSSAHIDAIVKFLLLFKVQQAALVHATHALDFRHR